jgi:hypothetical protein
MCFFHGRFEHSDVRTCEVLFADDSRNSSRLFIDVILSGSGRVAIPKIVEHAGGFFICSISAFKFDPASA